MSEEKKNVLMNLDLLIQDELTKIFGEMLFAKALLQSAGKVSREIIRSKKDMIVDKIETHQSSIQDDLDNLGYY